MFPAATSTSADQIWTGCGGGGGGAGGEERGERGEREWEWAGSRCDARTRATVEKERKGKQRPAWIELAWVQIQFNNLS